MTKEELKDYAKIMADDVMDGEMYHILVKKYGCGDMIWSEEEASQLFNNALSELTQESIERHHLN